MIIGLIFLVIIEALSKSLKVETEFDNRERISISVLWPLALIIFLFTLIRELIKHNK
tara:strand:- start:256 stop:426 length:171 start_codon:yes stop_codon:yes gene_type:complete